MFLPVAAEKKERRRGEQRRERIGSKAKEASLPQK
jgi:hypothetical protein